MQQDYEQDRGWRSYDQRNRDDDDMQRGGRERGYGGVSNQGNYDRDNDYGRYSARDRDYGRDYGYRGGGYDRDYRSGSSYGADYGDYGYGQQGYSGSRGSGGYGQYSQSGRYGRQAGQYSGGMYTAPVWTYTEVWLIPGEQTGKGPQGYQRSDDRIQEEVCERLTQHGQVDASRINAQVQNGEITLTGTVDNRDAKRMAEDTVETISGVKDVHNQLRVSQGQDMQSGQSTGQHSQHGQPMQSQGQQSGSQGNGQQQQQASQQGRQGQMQHGQQDQQKQGQQDQQKQKTTNS